ncbi:hypothetical protein DFH27DRAFT_605184 [Peziza echinospora]|nr:hypothetical protein DFH27DRAFT_605184 [Peziza echinospora]
MPEVPKRFYALIAHQIHLYGIPPPQLFNCDEKGITMGRTARGHNVRGNSNRESATALETTSAAGNVLPPFWWYTDLPEEEASFAVQANATMDVELGIAYMADHLDKHTAAAAATAC